MVPPTHEAHTVSEPDDRVAATLERALWTLRAAAAETALVELHPRPATAS